MQAAVHEPQLELVGVTQRCTTAVPETRLQVQLQVHWYQFVGPLVTVVLPHAGEPPTFVGLAPPVELLPPPVWALAPPLSAIWIVTSETAQPRPLETSRATRTPEMDQVRNFTTCLP